MRVYVRTGRNSGVSASPITLLFLGLVVGALVAVPLAFFFVLLALAGLVDYLRGRRRLNRILNDDERWGDAHYYRRDRRGHLRRAARR